MSTRPQPPDDRLLRLSAYLDGALPPAEQAAFEAELAADAALRAELAAYRRLDDLVQALRPALPAVDWSAFAATARARREAIPAGRFTRRLFFRVYAPLAAAAALVFVVTAALVYQEHPGSPSLKLPAGQPTVLVQLEREGPPPAAAKAPILMVSLDRALPPEANATVGPIPQGRTLVIAGGISPPAPVRSSADEVETLF